MGDQKLQELVSFIKYGRELAYLHLQIPSFFNRRWTLYVKNIKANEILEVNTGTVVN